MDGAFVGREVVLWVHLTLYFYVVFGREVDILRNLETSLNE